MKQSMALGIALVVAWGVVLPSIQAGEKVHTVGKDGLKLEGKFQGNEPKVKFEAEDKELEAIAYLHQIKLTGGKNYKLTMKGSDDEFDSLIIVFNSDGKQLALDDDSGGKLNSLLHFKAEKDGVYKIYTASLHEKTGNYFFQVVEEGGPNNAKPEGNAKPNSAKVDGKVHELGQDGLTIKGDIAVTDPKLKFELMGHNLEMPGHVYQVKLEGGKKYKFTMDSQKLDSILAVCDQDGKQLACDDDGGAGPAGQFNSLINLKIEKTGVYRIYAGSLDEKQPRAGDFVMKIVLHPGDELRLPKEDGTRLTRTEDVSRLLPALRAGE